MTGPTNEEFIDWFQPKPVDEAEAIRLGYIRLQYERTLAVLLNNIPPSAHRTDAVRSLLKASQAAVFAYTHRPKETTDA